MRTSRLIAYFRGTIKHPVLLIILRAAPYALICIVIAVVFSRYVPINMDEFVQYHPLLCHFYPLNTLNIYREPCGLYDLDLLGTGLVLPLRAFGTRAASFLFSILRFSCSGAMWNPRVCSVVFF